MAAFLYKVEAQKCRHIDFHPANNILDSESSLFTRHKKLFELAVYFVTKKLLKYQLFFRGFTTQV